MMCDNEAGALLKSLVLELINQNKIDLENTIIYVCDNVFNFENERIRIVYNSDLVPVFPDELPMGSPVNGDLHFRRVNREFVKNSNYDDIFLVLRGYFRIQKDHQWEHETTPLPKYVNRYTK